MLESQSFMLDLRSMYICLFDGSSGHTQSDFMFYINRHLRSTVSRFLIENALFHAF